MVNYLLINLGLVAAVNVKIHNLLRYSTPQSASAEITLSLHFKLMINWIHYFIIISLFSKD